MLDRSLVTGYLQVADDEAIAAEEGLFAGFSTGAHLAAALQLLRDRERGSTIAFLACDSGLKYLSTDLFPTQIGRKKLVSGGSFQREFTLIRSPSHSIVIANT